MGEVIAGRLAGAMANGYTNDAMQWGVLNEPLARAAYQGEILIRVEEVGCILHPTIDYALASPDGLIGDLGMLEIKCPMTHNHIEYISTNTIPGKYILQMQWQLACAERKWCDFVSFDPRMPKRMQLYIQRAYRDEEVIGMLNGEVVKFLNEVASRIRLLNGLYPEKE